MAAPDLLDEMTQLLAYVGDEGAQDGYRMGVNNVGNTRYSVAIRNEPLLASEMNTLIAVIIKFLNDVEDTEYQYMPDDIKTKVNDLKTKFDAATPDKKSELIDYILEYRDNLYEGQWSGQMHGGRRRNNKNRRNTKKRRNNKKKTRRSRH